MPSRDTEQAGWLPSQPHGGLKDQESTDLSRGLFVPRVQLETLLAERAQLPTTADGERT